MGGELRGIVGRMLEDREREGRTLSSKGCPYDPEVSDTMASGFVALLTYGTGKGT